MLGHNTPADARHNDIAHDPTAIIDWLERYMYTDGRTRAARIHLRPSPGAPGAEGYGTRLSLTVSHDRERRALVAFVSLDEHRPASPETHGLESTRFKVGKGGKCVYRAACARYSERQLDDAYQFAIDELRANPETLTDLARSYES